MSPCTASPCLAPRHPRWRCHAPRPDQPLRRAQRPAQRPLLYVPTSMKGDPDTGPPRSPIILRNLVCPSVIRKMGAALREPVRPRRSPPRMSEEAHHIEPVIVPQGWANHTKRSKCRYKTGLICGAVFTRNPDRPHDHPIPLSFAAGSFLMGGGAFAQDRDGERVLYNGITLPSIWPPRDGDVLSSSR